MTQHAQTARAPGKVNLGLWVGQVDPSGYHPLLTAFQAVELWETVTVEPSSSPTLTCSGSVDCSGVPLDASNLAWRAALALGEKVGRTVDVALHIEKNVPVAGGMAGGSADAAATLLALRSYWQLDIDGRELHDIAATLGSDVAFSLQGGAAIGRGRGEQLETVVTQQPLHWVVVPADFSLSTAEVYRHYDHIAPQADIPDDLPKGFLEAWATGDAQGIAGLMHNDLEAAACSMRPELTVTVGAVVGAGALRAMVSGSGPTVMGLAESADHARDVVGVLRAQGYPALTTQSAGAN